MHIHPSSPNSSASLLQTEEESAAIKIQAGFRGYRVRKQLLHHQTHRCTTNGYHNHHHHHHHHHSSSRHHRYSQRRQHRRGTEQLAMDQQGSSTVNGVSSLRDERSSGSESSSIEDRCATKIQAGVRGFLVRKKQKIATDAATKIQAGFRGFKARKEAQKMKQQ